MYKNIITCGAGPRLLAKDDKVITEYGNGNAKCSNMTITKKMKRINNLFDKICTLDNVYDAYNNAIKGKNHYRNIVAFNRNLDANLREIQHELETLEYKTSPYHKFKLKSGGKLREVSKLPFRDRIVQHAIMIHIEPVFRKSFIFDTFSSIKGKGIHAALGRLKKAMKDRDGTRYCLKMDIHKFYPSIDKELLKRAMSRKFKDKRLLKLLFDIIDSNDDGVPIGNYTSQYFANFFLSPMDHWLKETMGVKYYFRYCDDMVILGASKEYLHNLRKQIEAYLNNIKLQLKPNWQVFPVDDRSVDFLGYKTRHDYVLVRKRIKRNFIRKIKECRDMETKRHILGSYWGIFCHANCINLWRKYTGATNLDVLRTDMRTRLRYKDIAGKDITIMSYKDKLPGKIIDVSAIFNGRQIRFYVQSRSEIRKIQSVPLPWRARLLNNNGVYWFDNDGLFVTFD